MVTISMFVGQQEGLFGRLKRWQRKRSCACVRACSKDEVHGLFQVVCPTAEGSQT